MPSSDFFKLTYQVLCVNPSSINREVGHAGQSWGAFCGVSQGPKCTIHSDQSQAGNAMDCRTLACDAKKIHACDWSEKRGGGKA